jgi:DNA-binding NtrC family response regulator
MFDARGNPASIYGDLAVVRASVHGTEGGQAVDRTTSGGGPRQEDRPSPEFARLNLVGESHVFVRALACVDRIARCDATVLIYGETGTGKDLAARAIHYLGRRHAFPFVPVNCGAVPDNLVENEFFGHVKGAFTDAKDAQPGLVANAEGGTLFLDEVECLSPKGQVVLLRFLQDQLYRPLGGRRQVHGNVRIIAASNRDLARMAREGEFRQDLLYRLAIMSFSMPALRERERDICLLAEYFVRRFARQYGAAPRRLDAESVAQLMSYTWPGNVRELENLIHREFLLAEDGPLRIRPGSFLSAEGALLARSDSGIKVPPFDLGFSRAKAAVVAEFERAFIDHALAESRGNVSQAARRAGKERRAFGKLIKKYGIDCSHYRRTDS